MSDAALLPYNHSRSTSPAVSRRGRASRMPTRCAPSLPPCGALTRRQSEQEIMSYDYPDPKGHFGPYGGPFVAETLMEPRSAERSVGKKCVSTCRTRWVEKQKKK